MKDNATQSYRDNLYLGAAAFAGAALLTYFTPGSYENEMDDIDKAVGQ